jgi:cysteine desulfurase
VGGSGTRLQLDCNASAPLWPEAAEAVARALALPGNPSSIHAEGRAARALVEQARVSVAALVGASPADVIFTSGATEAAHLALRPGVLRGARQTAPQRLLVSATEHAAVLHGHSFGDRARLMPVDADGLCDIAALDAELAAATAAGERVLVALQHANSETGVIQPVAAVAGRVHAAGGLLLVDAAQSAGKLPVAIAGLGADALVLSGHKLGGPKGVGALVLAGGRIAFGEGLPQGGGQERGRRGGTENVPGIAGFGAAADAARAGLGAMAATAALRDALEAGLRARHAGLAVFGKAAGRLPNTSLFAVPGRPAETLLMALDLAGVSVSSGSACSSGKVGRSHVLEAMRVPAELAAGALRVSLDRNATESLVTEFLARFSRCVAALGDRRVRRDAAAA